MKKGERKESIFGLLIKDSLIGCGCGLAVCCAILLLGAAAFASMERLPAEALAPVSLASAVFGGIVSGFVSARLLSRMGLIAGICGAFWMLLLLLGVSFCFPGESVSFATAATKVGAILLAGGAGGMAAMGKRQKIRRR